MGLLSTFRPKLRCAMLVASWGILAVGGLQGQTDAAAVRFFEERVRPLLAQKCLSCHNDQAKMSGLSLASRESAMLGGSRGSAVIPGQPAESLLIQAVHRAGSLKMPPTGPLQSQEVATLTEWVRSGAAWAVTAGKDIGRADASHWSFQAVRRPEPPSVSNEDWVRTPIDRFVLARLEAKQIHPSPEAPRRTLIRRVSLDLIGLPPSPEEVAGFLSDSGPGAYERLVDRLLDSPHYGERWGRHWLDIARYADSNGYSIDGNRSMWRYRDWVINALNDNMPFDRFVREQIAGDLLPDPTTEALVATGFHRNTMINQEGGIDFEQYRVEAVVDRVSTTGAAFLGLTIGCARCHDHKFDPISQKDFYQLYAFFNNIDELSGELSVEEAGKREMDPILEFGEPADFARRDAVRHQVSLLEEELASYRKALDKELADWEQRLSEKERAEIEPHIRQILETPREKRVSLQKGVLDRFFASRDPGWQARRDGLRALRAAVPKLESTLIMRELAQQREGFVHVSGDFTRRGETVHPDTPSVLPPLPKAENPNRLDLARWLMSSQNPLTARVTVNRMWQRYFGLGLVETESDFGSQGTPPSHPELLDWLASEFIRQDWNLKAMHRLIVTSATYRQESATRPELSEVDPGNRLLARQNRLRLEAEIIRDAALATSALLTPEIGGPSVFPPQPEGSGQFTQVNREWKTAEGPDRYRRGVYTFFRRSAAYPGLAMFDAPNAQATTTRRNRSNTPLQALTLLNDQTQTEFSRSLAKVTLSQGGASRSERIRYVFERCLTRLPLPAEEERLRILLSRMVDGFRTHPEAIPDVIGETEKSSDRPLQAAWTAASRVLLNLDEFVTRP
jgi:hypothetical protein